jgi:choline dehydrogenase-like flavoprotein
MMPSYYVHSPVIGDANIRAIFMLSDDWLRRESRLGISLSIYEAHRPGEKTDAANARLEPGIVEMLRGLHATPGNANPMIYGVSCAMEPLASRDNRVTLTSERDALGMRRVRLTWRPTAAEHAELGQNIATLARSFGGWQGAVRVMVADSADWPQPEIGWGNHHMGTTRMANDPTQGVVDADCRVHGISNLYVAGSSVFPSCGPINPTLTIVALAMRLADHIKARGTTG